MRRSLGQARFILAVAGALATADTSWAQSAFPDPQGSQAVPGAVTMCLNAKGQAVPCPFSDLQPAADVALPNTPASSDKKALVVTPSPNAFALKPVSTAALAANLVAKNGAGKLWSFEVSADSTLSGAAWWIMLYDATAAPGDGAVTPLKCYAMASGTTSYSAAFITPIAFISGLVIGVSTIGCFTKTASTHAFISADFQ